METLLFGIIGAVVGVLLGFFPLISGVKRGKQSLGIAGFFACAISGFLLGILLAGPVCAVFAWLIRRQPAPLSVPPPLPMHPPICATSNRTKRSPFLSNISVSAWPALMVTACIILACNRADVAEKSNLLHENRIASPGLLIGVFFGAISLLPFEFVYSRHWPIWERHVVAWMAAIVLSILALSVQ